MSILKGNVRNELKVSADSEARAGGSDRRRAAETKGQNEAPESDFHTEKLPTLMNHPVTAPDAVQPSHYRTSVDSQRSELSPYLHFVWENLAWSSALNDLLHLGRTNRCCWFC